MGLPPKRIVRTPCKKTARSKPTKAVSRLSRSRSKAVKAKEKGKAQGKAKVKLTPRQRSDKSLQTHKGNKGTKQKGGKRTKNMTTLDQLNAISWDVLQLPERAMWKGKTAAENRLILEKVIHQGSIRLLLPVVRNTSEENGRQMVVYSVIVKGRESFNRDIRFGDILHKIHGFYMGTKVSEDDIAYASMGDASVPIGRKANQIRFGNFIEGQTRFGGLKDQGNGTYVLSLQ